MCKVPLPPSFLIANGEGARVTPSPSSLAIDDEGACKGMQTIPSPSLPMDDDKVPSPSSPIADEDESLRATEVFVRV